MAFPRSGGTARRSRAILPFEPANCKRAITLKTSVTEAEGVAAKPVLPTPPERGPRDGARTARVCRGNARAVSAGDKTGAWRALGRVLRRDRVSSQGGDSPARDR